MTTYNDKITNIPLSIGNITSTVNVTYISALSDFVGLLTNDPTEKLEPSYQKTTTETTFFTRYVLLAFAPTQKMVLASIRFLGTGHVYIDALSGTTYYYKLYAKLTKTADFSTFTDVTPEVQIMNYTNGGSNTAGWYDYGSISGVLTGKAQLNAGEVLLLTIRGTSYVASNQCNTAIGLNTSNFKLYPLVLG